MSVELVMSDGFVNLVEQGIDVAIRVGNLPDASLIAQRIETTRRVTVASPAYFERRGVPRTHDDLAGHDCIVYTALATGNEWYFEGKDGPIKVRVSGRLSANNSEAVREAVLTGCGIAVTPTWLFRNELVDGSVRHKNHSMRGLVVVEQKRERECRSAAGSRLRTTRRSYERQCLRVREQSLTSRRRKPLRAHFLAARIQAGKRDE
jgi:DNA-binding transcriptional LysR family regulator